MTLLVGAYFDALFKHEIPDGIRYFPAVMNALSVLLQPFYPNGLNYYKSRLPFSAP